MTAGSLQEVAEGHRGGSLGIEQDERRKLLRGNGEES